MQAIEIMKQLHSMGIHLSVHGEKILAEPKSAITDNARQLIRSHKAELMIELQTGPDAEVVATLAEAFYSHLFGVAKETGCCYARNGRYCEEGERLRKAYYQAEKETGIHVH